MTFRDKTAKYTSSSGIPAPGGIPSSPGASSSVVSLMLTQSSLHVESEKIYVLSYINTTLTFDNHVKLLIE